LRFSAVYRVGGSKSLPLFIPETGGGSRAKNRSFKRCHEIFRRVHWNNRGKKSIVWRCVSRLENTGLFCTASTILEDTLKEKIVEAINIAVSGKNSFLAILKKNIETVLSEDLDESTADIDKRLEELQTELIQKANSKEAYDNIVNEIYRLTGLKARNPFCRDDGLS
jgi:site-specific DNA recombinase